MVDPDSECASSDRIEAPSKSVYGLTHVSVSIEVSPFRTSLGTELLERDQNHTFTSVEVRSIAYLQSRVFVLPLSTAKLSPSNYSPSSSSRIERRTVAILSVGLDSTSGIIIHARVTIILNWRPEKKHP